MTCALPSSIASWLIWSADSDCARRPLLQPQAEDHWLLLLRARAVENQVFVIGANMVDREHPRRALWGGSALLIPGECAGEVR